jgi:hypothetical protein
MGNFSVVGQKLDGYVNNQIYQRQKIHGKSLRNDSDIQFLSNRNAWLKLASGVFLANPPADKTQPGSKFGKGMNLAMANVLFNGNTYYDNRSTKNQLNLTVAERATNALYDRTSKGYFKGGIGPSDKYDTSDPAFGITPMPGLISAEIKTSNMGSIEKANVRLKINNREQFDIIDELYLRLGYDMLLEWGWDKYVDNNGNHKKMGNTLLEDDWFDPLHNQQGFEYWLPKIREYKEKYDANYGGAFMKVTNFDWTFNSDGTYDVTLKLISHGDVIESIRTIPPHSLISTSPSVFLEPYVHKILEKDPIINQVIDWRTTEHTLLPPVPPMDENDDGTIDSTEIANARSASFQVNSDLIKDRFTEHLYNLLFIGYGLNNDQNFNVLRTDPMEDADDEGGDVEPEEEDDYRNWNYYSIQSLKYKDSDVSEKFEPENNQIRISSKEGKNPQYREFSGIVGRKYWSFPTPHYIIDPSTGRFIPQSDDEEKQKGYLYEYEKQNLVDGIFLNKFGEPGENDKTRTSSIRFTPREMSCYVRFGYLLYVLGEYFIPKNNDGEGIPQFFIESASPIPMYIPPSQKMTLSYKPSQFLFKKFDHDFTTLEKASNFEFNLYSGLEKAVWRMDGTEVVVDGEEVVNPIDDPILGETRPLEYLEARNIYISINYLLDIMPIDPNNNNESRIDLLGLLKTICTDINQSLGNVNNLQPIIDKDTNLVRIIDTTNFPERDILFDTLGISIPDADVPSIFQIYGYKYKNLPNLKDDQGTFVRKIDLKTTVSKEFANMVSIGATAKGYAPSIEATAFSRFNAGKFNRFQTNFNYPDLPSSPRPNIFINLVDGVKDAGYYTNIGYSAKTSPGQYVYAEGGDRTEVLLWELDSSIQEKNIRTIEDYFKAHEGKIYEKDTGGSPTVGFLPFGITLIVDGITGIKIYNQIEINTDFLPSNYPITLDFVLKGVSHRIENNDWITTLETIACPKPKPDPERKVLRGEMVERTEYEVIEVEGDDSDDGSDEVIIPDGNFNRLERSVFDQTKQFFKESRQGRHPRGNLDRDTGQSKYWCAGGVTRIVLKLKERWEADNGRTGEGIPIPNGPNVGFGNANDPGYKTKMLATGLYNHFEMRFNSRAEISEYLRAVTYDPGRQPLVGAVYQYYNLNYRNRDEREMHVQMWTGDMFLGKKGHGGTYRNIGWITDDYSNYGMYFVYKNRDYAAKYLMNVYVPKFAFRGM